MAQASTAIKNQAAALRSYAVGGLVALSFLFTQSCGIGKLPGATTSVASRSAGSAAAYSTTVYPYVRSNCVSCHGAIQTPMFAHAQLTTAYDAALTVVSFTDPELSTMVRKNKDGHCGANCNTDGTTLIGLINAWKAASAASGNPGGEEVRVGNIITSAINVPAPNPTLCVSAADLACTTDGLLNGATCTNKCWTKLKFPASQMTGIKGAANTAADASVNRSWFEIDFAYENYNSASGPASYVLRNPRVIAPDGAVYIFDTKIWLNGNYRPELGGAYRKIDTVVDKATFDNSCTIARAPAALDPTLIGASCRPASAPLYSTAASAAGILQEKTSLTAPDVLAFSFEYYKSGAAGECQFPDVFMDKVYAPIQRFSVGCLHCHTSSGSDGTYGTGGSLLEAGKRFNMDLNDPLNGATADARKMAVCKKFLQRSNFKVPDSSPIITQPTQGLNGMPAQPNFDAYAPDWRAWIEMEGAKATP